MLRRWRRQLTLFIAIIFTCAACGSAEESGAGEDEAAAPDLSYEIVSGDQVPQKLSEKILQEQGEKFGFSYRNGEDLYIAFGFGQKETGGYSIQITAAKDMGNKILIEAHLIAPQAGEVVSQSASYPYMVLLTKDTGAEIQFRLKDVSQ